VTVNNDVHTLTGAYVLDALSEMERRAFENHMSDCPACNQEVAELRETTARLGAATAAYPPPELWSKVLTATKQSRQLPPLSENRVVRPKRWGTRVAVFAAAASVVAAAGLGVGWYMTNSDLQDELAQSQVELDKVRDVLSAPDVKVSRGSFDGGGTATAMVSQSQSTMVMMVKGAPALPENRVYQAWYIAGDKATPAGLLGASNGSISADDLSPAAGATMLGITIEQPDGAQTPTLPIVGKIELT
jgi:anti-sigma-K factor RskA